MHIGWQDERCILCLNSSELTIEHIIPDSLGGTLTCDFLCAQCNSTVAHTFESTARTDPSIRLAIHNLDAVLPDLSMKLRERQKFAVQRGEKRDKGVIKDGMFKVTSRVAEDGSLIQPARLARKTLEKILRKSGYDEAPIAEAQRRLDEAPADQQIEIVPGLEVIKWKNEPVTLDFSGNHLMSELVPTKIAFEFIACHLGVDIYGGDPPLNELRRVLREGAEVGETVRVERLNASDYQPFHGICFEGNKPHAQVLIRLFGWLGFRVHFLNLSIGGGRYVYTHRLDTKSESIQMLR